MTDEQMIENILDSNLFNDTNKAQWLICISLMEEKDKVLFMKTLQKEKNIRNGNYFGVTKEEKEKILNYKENIENIYRYRNSQFIKKKECLSINKDKEREDRLLKDIQNT